MSSPIGGANAKSRVLNVVAKNADAFDAKPDLDREEGTQFGWGDRLFYGWQDGMVFDYGDWEARDLQEMMRRDYKARQIDNVLSLPIISATHTIDGIKGDTGESDWLNAYWSDDDMLSQGCETPLSQIIGLCTSAFVYKRAYFEKVWTVSPEGKQVYKRLSWRPQTTCQLARDPQDGSFQGFRQQAYFTAPGIVNTSKSWPIYVKPQNSFVHIHGAKRDPLQGLSDLEIPYWAWKTKQKILFLWFQFLEGVSLPRTAVYATEQEDANRIAAQVAKAKSSAVIPIYTPAGPGSAKVESLDVSGKGADQFKQAIDWLDQCATNAVLAGFLDLTGQAANGRGSYALSNDASDFFLQSLEAKTTELASSLRRNLMAPLIRWNFGPKAKVPSFTFEPLSAEDKTQQITMLTDLMRSRDPALVPDEFIGQLATNVADALGMDGEKIRTAFDKASAEAKAKAAAMSAAGASLPGQQVAGAAGAVNAAGALMARKPPSGPKPPSVAGINTPPLPSTY